MLFVSVTRLGSFWLSIPLGLSYGIGDSIPVTIFIGLSMSGTGSDSLWSVDFYRNVCFCSMLRIDSLIQSWIIIVCNDLVMMSGL